VFFFKILFYYIVYYQYEFQISYDDVDDSLEKETKEECSKYGIVEKCVVHMGRNSSGNAKPAVRIFVTFKYPEAASKAQNDLNGRFFGSRKVAASYFDEIRFMHQDYDD
jgi:RNA recognition motif-containing protein